VLRPALAGRTIVGPATTVRNVIQREHVYEAARNQRRRAGRRSPDERTSLAAL
jgi:4-hydroxy-4-methyl-2-oxoglutarate aldolase